MAKLLARGGPSLLNVFQEEYRDNRVFEPLTKDGWLRASSLGEICARQEVLAARTKTKREELIDLDSQLTFDKGHGMHAVMQNSALPRLGVIRGRWRCWHCTKVYGGSDKTFSLEAQIPCPEICTACKNENPKFEYIEQWFENVEYRVNGHPDAFLVLPDEPRMGVGELKSISERKSKDVRDVPDFGHVIQVQTYMWLTGLEWGLILYWIKGAYRSSLIEHYIERDEDAIDMIKNLARSIWDNLEEGELPERICSSADCKRAENCWMRNACFEGAL